MPHDHQFLFLHLKPGEELIRWVVWVEPQRGLNSPLGPNPSAEQLSGLLRPGLPAVNDMGHMEVACRQKSSQAMNIAASCLSQRTLGIDFLCHCLSMLHEIHLHSCNPLDSL